MDPVKNGGITLCTFGIFSGIFWKGKRKRGWVIAATSIVVFSVVAAITEKSPPSTTIVATTENTIVEPAEDIPVAVVPNTDVSPQEIDQPIEVAQTITPDVVEPEPSVLSSQSILETPEAFAAYCAWRNEGTAMAKRADELYGNDNDKWYAFYTEQDNLLSDKLTQQIGVSSDDWLNYSIQHNWDQECKTSTAETITSNAVDPVTSAQLPETVIVQAPVDPREAALIVKTHTMAGQIANTIRQNYNIMPTSPYGSESYCRDDNFCELVVGEFYITVFGAGIVEVETTTQETHHLYREICSAVFSAISGANLDFSAAQMEAAFSEASQVGPVKFEINNVETKISEGFDGILGCRFFKFGS